MSRAKKAATKSRISLSGSGVRPAQESLADKAVQCVSPGTPPRGKKAMARRVFEGIVLRELLAGRLDEGRASLEEVAHHEAAHAVAYAEFGFDLGIVTIISDGVRDGCTPLYLPRAMDEGSVRRIVIGLLAGRYGAKRFGIETPHGYAGDFQQAIELLVGHYSNEAEATAQFWALDRLASEYVESAWPAIKAVAALLMKDQEVDGKGYVIITAWKSGYRWDWSKACAAQP